MRRRWCGGSPDARAKPPRPTPSHGFPGKFRPVTGERVYEPLAFAFMGCPTVLCDYGFRLLHIAAGAKARATMSDLCSQDAQTDVRWNMIDHENTRHAAPAAKALVAKARSSGEDLRFLSGKGSMSTTSRGRGAACGDPAPARRPMAAFAIDARRRGAAGSPHAVITAADIGSGPTIRCAGANRRRKARSEQPVIATGRVR